MTAVATATSASTLLVGFDSAWTRENRGAIFAVLMRGDGTLHELGLPQRVNFAEARDAIRAWQAELRADATIVLLDQPTVVNNATGQRPVEHLVCSPVSLRLGGMQPANRARVEMFGDDAPVWEFLDCFGGAAAPSQPMPHAGVFETYPVLAIIALGWLLPHVRASGYILVPHGDTRGARGQVRQDRTRTGAVAQAHRNAQRAAGLRGVRARV